MFFSFIYYPRIYTVTNLVVVGDFQLVFYLIRRGDTLLLRLVRPNLGKGPERRDKQIPLYFKKRNGNSELCLRLPQLG